MFRFVSIAAASCAFIMAAGISAQVDNSDLIAVTDGEIKIALRELRYVVDNAPVQIKQQLRLDSEARYELIANQVVAHRIQANLESSKSRSGDLYDAYQFAVLKAAKEFDEKRFQRELEIPDLEQLAQERWRTSKNNIAEVPEKRWLSHILLLCSESCDEQEKQLEMVKIVERLTAGESFSDLAAEFSQDPGSRQRGGRLSRPIALEDENIDATFRETAFALQEKGQVSEVVKSRFGLHVMRLDSVEPARAYSFDEIKQSLMAEVEKQYREDAYTSYILSMGPSDALRINEPLLDTILDLGPN